MTAPDVCDRKGRFARLWISALVGLASSFVVALLLPTRDHFPGPVGGCGFSHPEQGWFVEGGDPVLILLGAVAITVAVYAMWNHRAQLASRALPRTVARTARSAA